MMVKTWGKDGGDGRHMEKIGGRFGDKIINKPKVFSQIAV